MNRNDAPVNLELPLNQRATDAQPPPQKTPSERDTSTDDIQTPSLNSGLRAAIDKMTQDTWDHSRGSNESHTALFTDLQKSPLQSPRGGENTRGCNISSSAKQSQVDTAIKTVEGTEIQVGEKVEGKEVGKLLVSDSVAPDEKIVEMETESAALHMTEHTETEKTKDAAVVDASAQEMKRNEHIIEIGEETNSELHNLKSKISEPAVTLLGKTPENTNLPEPQIKDFQEIQKPVTKVISIAELLRSQIKALDAMLANSVTTIPVRVEDSTTTFTETCKELKKDESKCKQEAKKSIPDRKTETHVDNAPPRNLKETLMEVYHQLHKTDQEQSQTQGATSPPAQALQKPLVTTPKSVVDTGTTVDTAGPHGSAKKYSEGVTDICQETGASTLVTLKDYPVVSLSGTENVKHNYLCSTSKDELTNRSLSNQSGTVSRDHGTPLTETPIMVASQESNINISEHVKDKPVQGKDVGFKQKLTPEMKRNSKPGRGTMETLLDQYNLEDHSTKNSSLQCVEKCSSKSVLGTGTGENNLQLIQQDSSTLVHRTDSSVNPTGEVSPLLKTRNCASPIPSATAQELASGARRKILTPKAKASEASEATSPVESPTQKKEVSAQSSKPSTSPVTLCMPQSPSRQSALLQPPGEQSSPAERRSPLLSRRKMTSETQAPSQQPKTEGKPAEKDKHDPYKGKMVFMLK